jgi:hypothetical protein
MNHLKDNSLEFCMTKNKIDKWLENSGIAHNPFKPEYRDAGADPSLSDYLVGPEWLLQSTLHDLPTFIFAPVGGGKTAFRVRLARSCRIGDYDRRILPVVYPMPWPTYLIEAGDPSEAYFQNLNRQIACELLLQFIYKTHKYLDLDYQTRTTICEHLIANFPGDLSFHIRQIDAHGGLLPLAQIYDRTALNLLGSQTPETRKGTTELIHNFCQELQYDLKRSYTSTTGLLNQSCKMRFNGLLDLVKSTLGYEAVYILLDGVDAYVETAVLAEKNLGRLLVPLLHQTAAWSENKIYIKYFLPEEFLPELQFSELLTMSEMIDMKWIWVKWTPDLLDEMIMQRLKTASNSLIYNLSSICTSELRDIQKQIIEIANYLPREVLILTERLLLEHVQRVKQPDVIELIDFETAVTWYRAFRQ